VAWAQPRYLDVTLCAKKNKRNRRFRLFIPFRQTPRWCSSEKRLRRRGWTFLSLHVWRSGARCTREPALTSVTGASKELQASRENKRGHTHCGTQLSLKIYSRSGIVPLGPQARSERTPARSDHRTSVHIFDVGTRAAGQRHAAERPPRGALDSPLVGAARSLATMRHQSPLTWLTRASDIRVSNRSHIRQTPAGAVLECGGRPCHPPRVLGRRQSQPLRKVGAERAVASISNSRGSRLCSSGIISSSTFQSS
jgi:hypothetical protein